MTDDGNIIADVPIPRALRLEKIEEEIRQLRDKLEQLETYFRSILGVGGHD